MAAIFLRSWNYHYKNLGTWGVSSKLITPRAHARSRVKQWVLSVRVSTKFWADHDNEGSIHF